MVSVNKAVSVVCLGCERPIALKYQPVEGQIITCPSCRIELEVINENPLELDFYFEDWDESDEEDDWAAAADSEWDQHN